MYAIRSYYGEQAHGPLSDQQVLVRRQFRQSRQFVVARQLGGDFLHVSRVDLLQQPGHVFVQEFALGLAEAGIEVALDQTVTEPVQAQALAAHPLQAVFLHQPVLLLQFPVQGLQDAA